MTRWRMLLWGAPVWLAACGAPLGQATLKTDRSDYAPGAELTLQLWNGSTQALGYNLCLADMQRRGGADWEQVPVKQDGVCQAILLRLEPGNEELAYRTLGADLPAGEYRFLTHVEWDGEREAVPSAPFRVVR